MSGQRTQQRVVVTGAVIGITAQVAILWGVFAALEPFGGLAAVDARLALAVRCSVFPALTLLVGVGAVANSRFLTASIDPLAHPERGRMLVYQRYLQNTLEQLVLFEVALFGLALTLAEPTLRLLPALAVNFSVGRIVFLAGYLWHPLYRTPGMAMTLYPTIVALGWLGFRVARDALS